MDTPIPAGGIPAFPHTGESMVADPAKGTAVGDFHPADPLTIKLVRCLEAVRDLKIAWRMVANLLSPDVDRRVLKAAATPLMSLAKGIQDLHGEFEHSEFKRMSKDARAVFSQRKERFDVAMRGADGVRVKVVRDKIAAHIDKETILGPERIWQQVDAAAYLRFLLLCVREVEFLIQPDVYAWTQHTEDAEKLRLMNVDGTLVEISNWGSAIEMITAISFVETPRQCVVREVNELIDIVNPIATRIGWVRE
jgi:hypothetical protein